jgi:hypothetical protein
LNQHTIYVIHGQVFGVLFYRAILAYNFCCVEFYFLIGGGGEGGGLGGSSIALISFVPVPPHICSYFHLIHFHN